MYLSNGLIVDYLQLIRSHISTRPLPKEDGSRKYADALSFWKDIHKKSQAKIATLEQKIDQLETENRKLRELERIEDFQNDQPTANSRRKRKRNDSQSPQYYSSPSKRCPLNNGISIESKALDEIRAADNDLELSLPSAEGRKQQPQPRSPLTFKLVTSYLSRLFSLRQVLSQASPLSRSLAAILVALASDASVLVSSIKDTGLVAGATLPERPNTKSHVAIQKPRRSLDEDNTAKMELVGKTFRDLIEAFGRLESGQGLELGNDVIYHFAKLFQTILTRISKLSSVALEKQNDSQRRLNKGKGRRRKKVLASQPSIELCGVRIELCKLFIRMFSIVSLGPNRCKEVADGAMYFLLTRAGAALKAFTFGTNDDEQTLSGDGTVSDSDYEVLLAEAPFLVWILERTMAATQRSKATIRTRPARASQLGEHQALRLPNLEISDIARSRLQNTLMKALFKEDEVNFVERLLEPLDPGLDLGDALPAVEKEDVANWFKREVWRLIGWDILRKSIDLEGDEGDA